MDRTLLWHYPVPTMFNNLLLYLFQVKLGVVVVTLETCRAQSANVTTRGLSQLQKFDTP